MVSPSVQAVSQYPCSYLHAQLVAEHGGHKRQGLSNVLCPVHQISLHHPNYHNPMLSRWETGMDGWSASAVGSELS